MLGISSATTGKSWTVIFENKGLILSEKTSQTQNDLAQKNQETIKL